MNASRSDTGSPEKKSHVLVVAYYFPPMGGSGVQRVAKWCRYFPENGWDVTVLTVEPGAYFAFDEDLLSEVEAAGVRIVRTRSADPTRAGKPGTRIGLQAEWKRRLYAWFTGFFFLPDNKRGWMRPALAAFDDVHTDRPVDLVLSSAPPYTSFLVGAALAESVSVPFIMDYRDDWLDNPRHRYPSTWHRARHVRLEQTVASRAAFAMAINEPMASRIRSRLPNMDVRVLPQGFDPQDMVRVEVEPARPDSKLRFVYAGMFYDAQQPDVFLRGVARALEQDTSLEERLELRFVGLYPESKRTLVEQLGLSGLVTFAGYLSHADTVTELMNADVLWMTVGHQEGEEMISTGKLFEYIGTQKPILALVPGGAARDALSGYGAAWIADPGDVEAAASQILDIAARSAAGPLPQGAKDWIEAYDRRKQTHKLAGWMDELARQTEADL